jgi:Rrf2 family protein
MKLITRDTDYALRALCFIAKHKGNIIPVSELVEELDIPRPFLRKILQILNKKGLLKSARGQGGGFLLAKGADKIFLTDLMRIFQGKLSLSDCFLKKLVCPHTGDCPLRKKILRIEDYVFNELGSVTIASLID